MTHLLRLIIFSFVLASLGACDSKPVEETVWDDQIKAMDKAREVEDKLMNRADDMVKQLEGKTTDKDDEDPPR